MSNDHNSAVSCTHVMRVPPELDVCIVHVPISAILANSYYALSLH